MNASAEPGARGSRSGMSADAVSVGRAEGVVAKSTKLTSRSGSDDGEIGNGWAIRS